MEVGKIIVQKYPTYFTSNFFFKFTTIIALDFTADAVHSLAYSKIMQLQ